MNERTKRKKRFGPILCAGLAISVLLIYLATFLYPLLDAQLGDGMAIAVLILGAAVILAMIAGVSFALYQRLKEIKGGEEEDAKQY